MSSWLPIIGRYRTGQPGLQSDGLFLTTEVRAYPSMTDAS
jgi:hypothetical protein